MALFGIGGGNMTGIAFVEITDPLEAGHAAHPRC